MGIDRDGETGELPFWLPSLRKGQSDWQVMLSSLASLYVRGVKVDWLGVETGFSHSRLMLPTYPFQRQRYWVESVPDAKSDRAVSQPLDELLPGNTKDLAQKLELVEQLSAEQVTSLLKNQQLANLSRRLTHLSPEKFELLKQLLAVIPDASDSLYEIQWQKHERQDRALFAQKNGKWLIFADRVGVGRALAELLESHGDRCFLIYPGDVNCPDDVTRLLQNGDGFSCRGIVHLWSLDAPSPESITLSSLEATQTLNCGSVLHLIQGLVNLSVSDLPRLWLVTCGSQAIEMSSPTVAQAPLWGLGRVISLEHPEIWGGLLDLDPNLTGQEAIQQQAQLLMSEIDRPDGEENLAFRRGKRYVARLVPSNPPQSQSWQVQPSGTYLITGGLGSLGLNVARSLVEKGARQILLVSRRGLGDRVQWDDLTPDSDLWERVKAVRDLEARGAKVIVAQGDVSDLDRMSDLIAEYSATLKGIIHAAGVDDDCLLQAMNLDRLQIPLQSKVSGAWILHQLTQNIKLDFFVCFSSIASIWGSKGKGHYAAGNAFLDALAHYRQSMGLPALSLNWGAWAEGGMASATIQTLLKQVGIEVWQPSEALDLLSRLLGTSIAQITAARVNWDVFKPIYEIKGERSLLKQINTQTTAVFDSQNDGKQDILGEKKLPSLLQQLEKVPANKRHDLLLKNMQTEVAQILGLPHPPAIKQGFIELGMDSLMAVELKNRLESKLGLSLSSTLIFNYPNIEMLVNYLAKEVLAFKEPLELVEQNKILESDRTSLEIDSLSEDELASLLDKELEMTV
ncbi:MAG: KR domain-containing protein [Hydrococcus sp. RU_2_2]|nr:KR domain-containing protein [Hydrococcus sp. RU_2_2]